MLPSAAANRGLSIFFSFSFSYCLFSPFQPPFFIQLTSTISRIELLRGNAEEAIRLNVREIEALQVVSPCHPMQLHPLNILAGSGPSAVGRTSRIGQRQVGKVAAGAQIYREWRGRAFRAAATGRGKLF